MPDFTYQPPAAAGVYGPVLSPSLLAVTVDGREIGAVWRSRNNKRGSWHAVTIDHFVAPGRFRTQDDAAEWLLRSEPPQRGSETGAVRIGTVVLLAILPGVLIAAALIHHFAR